KTSWSKVKSTSSASLADVDAAHSELTALVVDLILNDAGNSSNLILDPDLDSYWLMDIYVIKMPLLEDVTAATTAAALRPGKVDIDRVAELAGNLRVLSSNASDL